MDGGEDDDRSSFFQPNEQNVELITGMDFSRNAAIQALFYTNNQSADMAIGWILENGHRNLDLPLDVSLQQASSDSNEEEDDIAGAIFKAYKMVFVVNGELQMGVGKIAAQTAHAALGLYRQIADGSVEKAEALMHWNQTGETKIVLKGESTLQLEQFAELADRLKLDNYTVQDAGRTQVSPGSRTVLSIFGPSDDVDRVTKNLKLLCL